LAMLAGRKPRFPDPESGVLPLHHSRTMDKCTRGVRILTKWSVHYNLRGLSER